MSRSTSFALLLTAALSLGACKSGNETPAAAAAESTAAPEASGLAPDLGADHCRQIPAEQLEDYKRAHDQFHSVAGLEPEFVKGQLFKDGETFGFKWAEAGSRPLGVDVFLLRGCSLRPLGGVFLQETAPGSGSVSGTMYTSGAGSRYPGGTPALLRVTTTQVDAQTMKGTTTVVGEYTVTFQPPTD